MSAEHLREWAANFALLRLELEQYDERVTQFSRLDPQATERRGVEQLIGFQLGVLLRMALPTIGGLTPNALDATEGNEHAALIGRYTLELAALKVNGTPHDKTLATLKDLTEYLEEIALRWADRGVIKLELDRISDESKPLSELIESAAGAVDINVIKDSDVRNTKCYANTRGGCSAKISGEHYVSHGLLKLYQGERSVVTPTWSNRPIPAKSFVANILCTTHNNGLTSADSAALKFASFLKRINEAFDGGQGEIGSDEVFEVSGDDFQRWVLKLLINHAAASKTNADNEPIELEIIPEAIDLLLDRAQWPETWGLCVAGMPKHPHLKIDPISHPENLTSWWAAWPFIGHEGQQLRGGIVELAGVGFALSLFNQGRTEGACDDPQNPFYETIQRPASISWMIRGVEKRIEFSWNDRWPHPHVTVDIKR